MTSDVFDKSDWDKSYYRSGVHGIDIANAKSALHKEIRRGNDVMARFWAMTLLCSHKVENLMNRLLVIAGETSRTCDRKHECTLSMHISRRADV